MLINWFTVVAQIINFLVLVVLLKIFLFDRIVRAMDRRQERIDAALTEARESREEADRQAEDHRRKRQEIEDRRDELLRDARQSADRRREELEQQAEQDVEQQKKQWLSALSDQRESFLNDLRRKAGEQLGRATRKVLQDLADAELERQVTQVFRRKLDQLDEHDETREAMASADGAVAVHSAWSLPDETREELTRTIRDQLGIDRADVEFRENEGVLCGVEIRRGGRSLGWTADAYLDEMAQAIDESIEAQIRRDDRRRPGEERAQAGGEAEKAEEAPQSNEDQEEGEAQ